MDLHIIPATVGYYENLFSNQPASWIMFYHIIFEYIDISYHEG